MRNRIRPLLAAAALVLASGLRGVFAAEPAQPQAGARAERPTRIVTFLPGVSPEERRKQVEAAGGVVVRDLPFVDGVEAEFPGFTPQTAVRLRAIPKLEYVEPNEYRKWIETAALPALPASTSGALKKARDLPAPAVGEGRKIETKLSEKEIPWGVARVKAPALWEHSTGKGVRVAVIDTGIDFDHPDIAPNYRGGYNAVDPEGSAMDDHGHGTHVAGTIAAAGNDKGVIGVAPEASLFGVKVLDGEGGGTPATIVAGIGWCVENRMQVVNMSLGGPSSDILRKAVRKAYEAGLVIVAASGNDPEASVSAPASYPETIAVSASTSEDGLASFSTTGREVDVIAPGHEVLSAWPGSRLAKLSGTSMASPHVAGLAALAVSLGAEGPAAVKRAIKGSASPLDGLDGEQQGAGLPEADRWLR